MCRKIAAIFGWPSARTIGSTFGRIYLSGTESDLPRQTPLPLALLSMPCDYREFRPYLTQHPCGTLIADLVHAHWFRCWQAHRSLRAGSLCVAQSSSASEDREFVSRKNRVLDQQKCGQGKQTWTNRLVPAKRRVSGIGGVIPRPEESLPRALAPAVPPLWALARLWPKLNEYATADSRQNSFAGSDATISGSTP